MAKTWVTIEEYILQIPEDWRADFLKLRGLLRDSIPEGFEEALSYGFPGFVVPHSLYPPGYHCRPEEPLPFLSLASRKNSINVYHMGLYAMPDLLEWFHKEWDRRELGKLDMGKSCIRLKKNQIPFDLLGELAGKVTVQEWIQLYDQSINPEAKGEKRTS